MKGESSLVLEVVSIAKTVGTFIRNERMSFDASKTQVKAKNDLVSYVDKEAERLIVDALRKLSPEFGFITEENTAAIQAPYQWIIDPLDGTTNFIHGIPCYAVSIALAHEGKVILGVVYEVSRDECFYAEIDKGAYLNGLPIKVSSPQQIEDCLIATGFPVTQHSRLDGVLEALSYFIQNTHGVRRMGSAASDLCYLACGRVDAFYEYNLNAWDVAAGSLIVKEAGGIVSDFKGESDFLFGKEIMASSKYIYPKFSSVIKKAFKPRNE